MIGETIVPWDIIESLTPPEKPNMGMLTAYHEAGHAVVAVALDIKFVYVTMSVYGLTCKPGSNLGGVVFDEDPPYRLADFDPGNPVHRQAATNAVVLALEGEASESFWEERGCDILRLSAEGDYEVAMKCATLLHADPGACVAFIEDQKRVACNMVREPLRESQINAVANQLNVRL